ncbi:MAG: NAD(P)H-dependent oxidoreductase [Bacteroidota bacterium]
MITIISGTNRTDSRTIKISQFCQELFQEKNQEASLIDLADLPQDFLFKSLAPDSASDQLFKPMHEEIAKNEKFLFVVPEYNGSFPGVLKTFIDGMSYPSPFKGKKCALVGLSSGIQGSVLAMSHLTDIFNYLEMSVLAIKPKLSKIDTKMEAGKLTDPFYIKLLKEQADALIRF